MKAKKKPYLYKLYTKPRGITDAELIKDLRRTAKKLGKNSLTFTEYALEGKYAPVTPTLRFGTWNEAVTKAGLEITCLRQISDRELMENLKEVWDKLKRQPRLEDMIKPLSKCRGSVYQKHFGSWRKALEAFRRYINSHKKEKAVWIDRISLSGKKSIATKKKIIKDKRRNVTDSMRYNIMKRDKFRCVYCGRSPATEPGITLHVDHNIPWSKGGTTTLDNLVTACNKCNHGKGDK